MRFRRPAGPADLAESDRLLDAARDGWPGMGAAGPLAHLLAAAAAPAEPGELPGEERALAAFRAARVSPVPVPAPASQRRSHLRVGAAAWLAGLTATATAGVAVAAVSLERSDEPAPPPAPTAPSRTGGESVAAPTQAPSTAAGSRTPVPSTGSAPASTGTAGSGALAGHCRAYLAKSPKQRAKALTTPGFADLVAAAGGADRVEAYCTRLVGKVGSEGSPKASPTRSRGAGGESAPGPHTAKPGVGNGATSAGNGAASAGNGAAGGGKGAAGTGNGASGAGKAAAERGADG